MTTRLAGVFTLGCLLAVTPVWAQQGNGSAKKVYNGPIKQTFGQLDLVLTGGASSEVEYQPDQSRLTVRTLAREARVVTSARYLVLVENQEGTVEVTLPTGRTIKIEPGQSDIVGRALVDDPGTISIRIASTANITVLENVPAAALSGQVTTPGPINPVTGPRPETSVAVSPSSPSGSQGFGRVVP